nr:4-(cytidine 5'-diphospho)-2-C-methyl-D-erythritol kinase [Clostridia bacterium]
MARTIGTPMRANGKINLYLDVLSDGTSGFHKIKSIMQSVSLCDRVTVSLIKDCKTEIFIDCPLPFIPKDERNIMYVAAKLFLDEIGEDAKVNITLDKKIPVSGGMAGGSTDGAAVLFALNRLYGKPLTDEKLLTLGAKLGSDVPFCMMGRTAICEGRGEILTPVKNRAKLKLLIVPSAEGVSTPWAYGELDRMYGDFAGREKKNEAGFKALCKALEEGDVSGICDNMYNIFESAIINQRPLASRAKELLLESGAAGAMMSGSGPTVFGIFEDDATRSRAADILRKNGYSPKVTESIL